MALSLFLLASLTLTCLPLSWSYRDGARSESCYNMLVMHNNFGGQVVPPVECGSPCSYNLSMVGRVAGENDLTVEEVNPTTYQCGEVYQLQLVSTPGTTFEGFMIEARENTSSFEEGSTIWGTWVTDPNNRYHAVECNRSSSSSEGPFENAVTQSAPADLTSLDLYWRAPPCPNTTDDCQQLPEEIKFWFVTVQQRLTYISPVKGPVLVCEDPPPPTTTAMRFDFPTSTGLPFLMSTDFPPTTSTTSALLQPTLLTSLPFTTSTPLLRTTSTPPSPTTSTLLQFTTSTPPSPTTSTPPSPTTSTLLLRTTSTPPSPTTSTLLLRTILIPLQLTTSTPLPSTTSSPFPTLLTFPPTTRPLELIPIIVGAAGGAIALALLIILIIVCYICCKRDSDYYDKPLEGTRGRFRSTRKKKFEPTSFAIQNKVYIPQVLGVGQDKPANGTTKDGDEGYVVDETHAL